MMPLVSIAMTTYDSSAVLEDCLNSVAMLDYRPLEVIIVDNASSDGTRDILRQFEKRFCVIYNDDNRGFAAGQNQAIRQSHGDWVLSLNPDILLPPGFVSDLMAAAELDPSVGSLTGKLLRWTPGQEEPRSRVIDSAGIYFVRNLRHFDRGSEECDTGQYDQMAYVFGATGAAALYRRKMVEDVSIDREFFDEAFFAYREDADLSWRAQLMGWKCLYVPTAVAWHVRRVTEKRWHQLPVLINWHSAKNRFLMRVKNISLSLYARLAFPVTFRDLQIVGYCLLRDRKYVSALLYAWKHRQAFRAKRRQVQARRRVSDRDIARWFSNHATSFPLSSG